MGNGNRERWAMGDRRLKALPVLGPRPEANPMAPAVKELERCADRFTARVSVTASKRRQITVQEG